LRLVVVPREFVMFLGFFGSIVVLALIFLWMSVNVVNEYQRLVVFRLGRLVAPRGPGLVLIIPVIERAVRMDLRVVTLNVPPQDVITRDNVSVKVNAVVYFRVLDPNKALVIVENYQFATSQLSQTTLRSVCGQAELDELLAERERINEKIQTILDTDTEPWGIKVTKVEVKQIDLPREMQEARAHGSARKRNSADGASGKSAF
jgi:regulator of protease activity HflC (stomatin/prohibitin superfamily)